MNIAIAHLPLQFNTLRIKCYFFKFAFIYNVIHKTSDDLNCGLMVTKTSRLYKVSTAPLWILWSYDPDRRIQTTAPSLNLYLSLCLLSLCRWSLRDWKRIFLKCWSLWKQRTECWWWEPPGGHLRPTWSPSVKFTKRSFWSQGLTMRLDLVRAAHSCLVS